MDTYSEVLMEDLIDCDIEDTIGVPHSSWTEQALDLFISILKNVKRDNFSSQHEMLEVIAIKMSERGYRFTVEQIERKYNSLKKMYTEKKEKNQSVEPELSKLFGDCKARSPPKQRLEQPLPKKIKLDTSNDSTHTPDKSLDVSTDDGEEKKFLWSTESTRIFLDLLEQLRPQLGSKLRTKKQMWEEICRRLKAQGYNFTYPQVENKWKALLRHYRGRLEQMRNGTTARYGAWPELFESTTKKLRDTETSISFANDQKLPYDDDGYTDEEAIQFEEACPLPEVDLVSEDIDPVMIEDVKPSTQQLKGQSSTSNDLEKTLQQGIAQLEKISKEISGFREDNKKHQSELLLIKKMELQAYKDRTLQFSRIGDELGSLMGYLKRGDGDLNI